MAQLTLNRGQLSTTSPLLWYYNRGVFIFHHSWAVNCRLSSPSLSTPLALHLRHDNTLNLLLSSWLSNRSLPLSPLRGRRHTVGQMLRRVMRRRGESGRKAGQLARIQAPLAGLLLGGPSDNDCIICGVIKKPGLDLRGMSSERLHSGVQPQAPLFPYSSLPLLRRGGAAVTCLHRSRC